MRAGPMRHRVEIRLKDESQTDRIGGQVVQFRTVGTAFVQITPISGRERLQGAQLDAETTHRVWMRYRSDLTPKHQLRYGSRQFNIRSIINRDERGAMLELLCEEGVAQ